MGIYDRGYYRDEPQGFSLEQLTGGRSAVVTLLALNVVVFVIDGLLSRGPGQLGPASAFLSLHETDLAQPWFWFRFLTYGFAHANAQHILFNMIGLFFFGRAIEGILGANKFLWMYLTALLAGSVVWMIGVHAVPSAGISRVLLGASGAVVATVVLFCFYCPHQRVLFMMFIPMPAWVLGVMIVASDLFGALNRPASDIAFGVHLAGAAYAFFFYKTRWELSRILPIHGMGGVKRAIKPGPKLRVHRPDVEADETLAARADEVLKKLYEKGEASLTPNERQILEDYSRRVKQRR